MKSIKAMGSAAPGGSLSKPLMIAFGALLVGKMMSGGSAQAHRNQQHRPMAPVRRMVGFSEV